MQIFLAFCLVVRYNILCWYNPVRYKAKLNIGSEPDGYAAAFQKGVVRMEIAYIIAMAVIAIVAILANRRTKK
jgi:hypothetical protein